MTMDPSTQVQSFDWKHLFLSFEGRIRRSHFWVGWFATAGAFFVGGMIPLVGGLICLAVLWPHLAITVKRLHDMGHTGWLAAIPYVIGIVGSIVAFSMVGFSAVMNASALENEDPAAIMGLIGPAFGLFALLFLVGLGFLLWIGLTDSQPGDNRFGPNPKGM